MALARAGQHDRAIAEWRETVRLAPTAFGSTSRPGRCSAGRRRRRRSGCRVPRDPEAGARLDRSDRNTGRRPWRPRAKSRKQSPTWSEPWSSIRATPRPTSTWAWLSTIAGGHRVPSLISTRRFVFSPTMSRCCGKRPGFWRRVRIPRSAMERGRSNWPAERSSFPAAKSARAFDALAAALAETEEFSAAVDAAEQASTMALTRGDDSVGRRHRRSGRASTARACRIASRHRVCRLEHAPRTLPSKCLRSACSILRRLFARHRWRLVVDSVHP